ncbi:MAG: iron-hydroxamate transporter ATP-binding protein [marine bacterium B5-7]|nr:MAG: iron-hydroxamate transporter ATP-binding protein [marine bacterium B5-7]
MLKTNACISQQMGRALHAPLDLSFEPGESWAILGKNGAGKSTLLQTLAGLREPLSGDVTLSEKSLAQWHPRNRAQQIGWVAQLQTPSFPALVRDAVLMGRFPHQSWWQHASETDWACVQQALIATDLLPLADRCITSLSGGEWQRVQCARVLCQAPSVYLLDEPFSQLDVAHQVQLAQHVTALSETHVVIMILHDLQLAMRFCNKWLCMLPNGDVRHGDRDALCTAETLAQIYQHPFAEQTTLLPAKR